MATTTLSSIALPGKAQAFLPKALRRVVGIIRGSQTPIIKLRGSVTRKIILRGEANITEALT